MKLSTTLRRNGKRFMSFDCGYHVRYGKAYCFSHYIATSVLEEIVLDDIRTMAQRIVLDEKSIREEFVRRNAELADAEIKKNEKALQPKQKRAEELSSLFKPHTKTELKAKFPRIFVSGLLRNTQRNKKRLQKKSKASKKDFQKPKPLAIQPTTLSVILRSISMRPNLHAKCTTNLSTELLSAVLKA